MTARPRNKPYKDRQSQPSYQAVQTPLQRKLEKPLLSTWSPHRSQTLWKQYFPGQSSQEIKNKKKLSNFGTKRENKEKI